MEAQHNYQIGDNVTYEGIPAEVVWLDGPLIVEIYGKFGKSFTPIRAPHKNKLLAFMGFTTMSIVEQSFEKKLNVSFYSLNRT